MKTDLKIPFKVDRILLSQYNMVAKILGVALQRYVESYLKSLLTDLRPDPVRHVANELFYESDRFQRSAEGVVGELENFTRVTSDLYPDLGLHYAQTIAEWYHFCRSNALPNFGISQSTTNTRWASGVR